MLRFNTPAEGNHGDGCGRVWSETKRSPSRARRRAHMKDILLGRASSSLPQLLFLADTAAECKTCIMSGVLASTSSVSIRAPFLTESCASRGKPLTVVSLCVLADVMAFRLRLLAAAFEPLAVLMIENGITSNPARAMRKMPHGVTRTRNLCQRCGPRRSHVLEDLTQVFGCLHRARRRVPRG